MDFSDTREEAEFRQEARQWLAENAPIYLEESLSSSGFGRTNTGENDPLTEAKKWQKKNQKLAGHAFNGPGNTVVVVRRPFKVSSGTRRKAFTEGYRLLLSSARACVVQRLWPMLQKN